MRQSADEFVRSRRFRVDTITGLMTDCTYVPSPNHDEFPQGDEPELLVIHNISLPPGEFGGGAICELFTNSLDPDAHPYFAEVHQLRVSAHLLIQRDGDVIQFVPFNRRAWHAGVSCFQGRECCNDFSLGIELEGSDFVAFTEQQYVSLNLVIDALDEAYTSLGRHRLAGHSEIAPGRKTDPGPFFEWSRVGRI